VEDSLHGEADCIVVIVDGSWILRLARRSEFLCSGEERPDGFVSKHDQGGHRLEPAGHCLVPAGLADPADDLLATELLQIIGGATGIILGLVEFSQYPYLAGQFGSSKSAG
jgi:hypothetical protein